MLGIAETSHVYHEVFVISESPIVRRAVAFAESLKWEYPTVTSVDPPDDEIVATYGTRDHTDYLSVTIEMRWSPKARDSILANAIDEERADTERLLAEPMIVRVVCSATDIIHHEFPGTDLD